MEKQVFINNVGFLIVRTKEKLWAFRPESLEAIEKKKLDYPDPEGGLLPLPSSCISFEKGDKLTMSLPVTDPVEMCDFFNEIIQHLPENFWFEQVYKKDGKMHYEWHVL